MVLRPKGTSHNNMNQVLSPQRSRLGFRLFLSTSIFRLLSLTNAVHFGVWKRWAREGDGESGELKQIVFITTPIVVVRVRVVDLDSLTPLPGGV